MLPGLWLPLYIENILKTAIKFILPYFLDRNAFKYHCKILTDDLNRVNSKEIVSILLYGYDFFVCVLGYTDEGLNRGWLLRQLLALINTLLVFRYHEQCRGKPDGG